MPRVLVLGGIREARDLCNRLAGQDSLDVIASLAGRVAVHAPYPTPVRRGGFGGSGGLTKFLRDKGISLLVDCTHPFAVNISRNASLAANATDVPIARYERPPWVRQPGDNWLEFPDLEGALRALPKRAIAFAPLGTGEIFKLVSACRVDGGRLHLVIRTIEPVQIDSLPENIRLVDSRPPHSKSHEKRFLVKNNVSCLICRNSGGRAGRAKLDAAADLKLPVYMVAQPRPAVLPPNSAAFNDIRELETWVCSLASRTSHQQRPAP